MSERGGFDPTGDHEPLMWLAVIPPVLIGILLLDGTDVLWAAAVGLAAGALTFMMTGRDIEAGLVAGAAAALFVASVWAMLGAFLLLGAAAVALRFGAGWAFLAAAFAIPLPGVGVWVASAGAAFLVAWPAGRRSEQRLVLPFAGIALALLVGIVAEPFWAGVGGLAAGVLARAVCRHPFNLRSGRLLAGTAAVGAIAPPLAVLVLSALGRAPPLSEVATLATGFGLAAVGLLVFAYGQGAELALRTTPEIKAVLVAGGAAAAVAVVGAGAADGLDLAAVAASALWPLAAPTIGIGAVRWSRRVRLAHVQRLILWGTVLVLALAVRVLR